MTAAIASAHPIPGRRYNRDQWFYLTAAALMLISTAGGFRRFYLHGKAPWGDMTAQIVPLVIAHGVAMSS